jgi:CRISPR/Cas system-associated exonuclease Cas4 (RecB family)
MVTRKVIPIKQIQGWSFSRYNAYKECPLKAKYKFVDKLKEPGSTAMERGNAIHKLAEDYTKGLLKKLPVELQLFKEEFADLKKQKVKFVEEQWTFKADWAQTAWNDWNGAWLRIKTDVSYINTAHNALVVIDHKTGKYSERKFAEYEEQLELYGLAGLKQFPTVDVVSPRLWYLDHGIIHPSPDQLEIEYARKDEAYLDKKWRAKVKPMLADTTFKPKPGNACTYCHFKKANGGPCKY